MYSRQIGIVGRTGAGKSSLVKILFRLEDYQGRVSIDGINISKLPLHLLRKKISLISQDQVVFSGSARQNLDPCFIFSDEKLFETVQEVQTI